MIIRATDLTQSLWKNHGGTTTEIARSGADPASLRFDWRLSFADVKSDGPFSDFSGYDRWLVVWRGNGFCLDNDVVVAYQPYHFSGEGVRLATLLGGPVTDLGLIYKRDKFKATMLEIADVERLPALGNTNFIFVCDGELFAEGETLKSKDTLLWTRGTPLTLGAENLRAIFVSLSEI